MTDLDALTRALREEHSVEASSEGELGRRRLERAVGRGKRKRRLHLVALLAASFVGVTAWAGTTGRLPRVAAMIEALVASPEEPRDERHAAAPPSAVPAIASVAPTAIASEPIEPPPPPVVSAAPAPKPTVRPAPPPPPPDVDALYREAHAAHFDRKDPAAALAAWDRYLAAAGPSGRFTLEARYNRALALLRLGRRDEARAALEPFARGEYGGYRRDDATRLVESLR